MITGLQTLRLVALVGAFAFAILVLPATIAAAGPIFRPSAQIPAIALVFLGGAVAALVVRWLQSRRQPTHPSAREAAMAYRTRFLLQVGIAQVPGFFAFVFSIFVRPFPAIAILLGAIFTIGLVALVAPTERNLDRLQEEAGGHGDVRSALDELYSWRP